MQIYNIYIYIYIYCIFILHIYIIYYTNIMTVDCFYPSFVYKKYYIYIYVYTGKYNSISKNLYKILGFYNW